MEEESRAREIEERRERAERETARIDEAIEAFQAGREREMQYRRIFEHSYPIVLRFFQKRVFSADDQLDLTQETLLRVYKGLEGFRREARFGTWLFRIAHNTHLKWLRRLQSDGSAETVALPETDSEPGTWETAEATALAIKETALKDMLEGEQQRMLREAIGQLPGQMRESTRLRIYQELSYREISVVMRLSVETVKVHLFQARKKLKTRLQDISEVRI